MSIFDKQKLKGSFSKFSNAAKNTAENVVNATKGGASTVAKKSSELIEISKLTVNINSYESKIKNTYTEIGKIISDKHKKGIYIDPALVTKCDEILELEKTIEKIEEKISKLKNKKICPNCNVEIDSKIKFCPNCGAELPFEENTEEQSNVILAEEVETVEAEIIDEDMQSKECDYCENSKENTECECNSNKDNKTEE